MAKRGRPRSICAECRMELHLVEFPVKSGRLNKKFCDMRCFQEYLERLKNNEQENKNT